VLILIITAINNNNNNNNSDDNDNDYDDNKLNMIKTKPTRTAHKCRFLRVLWLQTYDLDISMTIIRYWKATYGIATTNHTTNHITT
jgi:hypothetical protein